MLPDATCRTSLFGRFPGSTLWILSKVIAGYCKPLLCRLQRTAAGTELPLQPERSGVKESDCINALICQVSGLRLLPKQAG